MHERFCHLVVCVAVVLMSVLPNGSMVTSARCAENYEAGIIEIAKLKSPDALILAEFDPADRENVASLFGNPVEQLKQIDHTLNDGYAKLTNDIETGKFGCIDKNELSQYQGSEWRYRSIGFPNWVKSIQGHLLLERARSIKYEILLLELVKRDETAPLLKERIEQLDTLKRQIISLTRDDE